MHLLAVPAKSNHQQRKKRGDSGDQVHLIADRLRARQSEQLAQSRTKQATQNERISHATGARMPIMYAQWSSI
jgi:hypothetical protein